MKLTQNSSARALFQHSATMSQANHAMLYKKLTWTPLTQQTRPARHVARLKVRVCTLLARQGACSTAAACIEQQQHKPS